MRRRPVSVAVALLLASGGSLGVATGASASPWQTGAQESTFVAYGGPCPGPTCVSVAYLYDGVAIRSGATTAGTAIYGRGYRGQWAYEHSTTRGGSYTAGNSTSNLWSYTTNVSTKVKGYSGFYFLG